jgi:hypothetical protein
MSLIDNNITEFFSRGYFPKEIQDNQGNLVAKLKFSFWSLKKGSVLDENCKVLFYFKMIKEHSLFWKRVGIYDILDGDSKLLVKIFEDRPVNKKRFFLKDLEGNAILNTEAGYLQSFEIKNMEGKTIASITNSPVSTFKGLSSDLQWKLKIEDTKIDRRYIFALFFIILYSYCEPGAIT